MNWLALWLPPGQTYLANNHPQPKHFGHQSPQAKTFWPPITPSQTFLATNHPWPNQFGYQSPPAKTFRLPIPPGQTYLANNHPQRSHFGYQSPLAKTTWLLIMLRQPKGQPIHRKHIIASKPNSSDRQPNFLPSACGYQEAYFASYHRQF